MRSGRLLSFLLLAGACHHEPAHPAGPPPIALEPRVEALRWYRAPTPCGQGPYELAVDASDARYGEDVELQLHTPRKVAIDAVVAEDGRELARTHATFDRAGATSGAADNARCVADARERLQLGRTGGTPGTGTGGGGGGGGAIVGEPPPAAGRAVALELDTALVAEATSVVHVRLPRGRGRVTIRLWSIDPNDLDGVRFGIAHVVWRPNVDEATYEAHLARVAADEAARRERAEREARERATREVHEVREVHVAAPDPEAEARHARERREREEREARARDERDRRAAIDAALELDRQRRRAAFCAAHHDDRSCWGPGGYTLYARLEQRRGDRTAYCQVHAEDARCWTELDWAGRRHAWRARVELATAPPKQPDGPPPAPRDETPPPRLSPHAEWRPGYWQWTANQWVWLAGMWRVPDGDLAAEQTTTAPAAPPPPQVEAPPPPPATTLVWIAGFWQWSGQAWVWVPGAYQLRPTPRATWRAPEWRVRGAVHILVPGTWVTP